MRRAAKLIAIVLAAITFSGTGIAAASAQRPASASHRGTEKFTLVLTSTKGVASVIATGLFTDGGTINTAYRGRIGKMKLGAGTIRLTTASNGPKSRTNFATCLTTVSVRGTYKLIGGTGRYAGIRGSGSATVTDRIVSRHKHGGGCVTGRAPLAIQAIFRLSGSATLRH